MGILLGLAAMAAWAQTSVNVIDRQPDCNLQLNLVGSTSGVSGAFDNRTKGCKFWTVSYAGNGWTTLSVTFQSAADNLGTPGTFGPFAGTLINGSNPSTAIDRASAQFSGYYPWIELAYSGTSSAAYLNIIGRVYGWRETPPVNAILAGTAGNGNVGIFAGCPKSAPISLSATGNTQIVALSAGQITQICHISFSTVAPEDFQLTYGTGANCAGGGGPTVLSGLYKNALTVALDLFGTLIVPTGQALCLNQSVAQATGGLVTYVQY
jgi:hypothetical protein